MYDINTIDDLVDALGGDSVLAESLGISQPAVANWKVRQQIGAGWHMRLFARLAELGMTVNPTVFGLSEIEGRAIFTKRPQRRGNVSVTANA